MRYRILGRTGLKVSVIALGAGPVPGLMTGSNSSDQAAVVARALAGGVNWFDTAPGYGNGQSESNLGRALGELSVSSTVHIATKVRLSENDLTDVEGAVRRSLTTSLARLRVPRVTLLQLHNGITPNRGDIPASLTPADVLGPIRTAFERLREEGVIQYLGLTGTGNDSALKTVIASAAFDTIQLPHHLLTPASDEVLRCCEEHDLGVLAIRVFAGGALLGQPPSAHTLVTPYFPLPLYEQDSRRARELAAKVGGEAALKELALRFVLKARVPQVALVGLATQEQVEELAALADRLGE